MRHLFIINPAAGGKKRDVAAEKSQIVELMDELGCDYEIYETVAPMDASEKVRREAIKGRQLRVYAFGGDGTLAECVHGAAGFSNAAVTQYPCGTGNDFLRIFGEKIKIFRNINALVHGETHPMDIIDVNGRKCMNICSVGIDARVGTDVHKYSRLPFISGTGAYIMSLVVNFIKGLNQKLTISTDQGEHNGVFALVCVCNGRFYGGGFNPTKTAPPDAGLLDVLIAGKVSRLKATVLLRDYANGSWAKHPQIIEYSQGRHVRIEGQKKLVINADGERLEAMKAEIRIVRGGVNFIYPMGCGRVAGSAANQNADIFTKNSNL